jgi:hypothetical protein
MYVHSVTSRFGEMAQFAYKIAEIGNLRPY